MLPILYSFRRCPYAIRARMTLAYADIPVEHREVLLRDKPAAMLKASEKGTVPILVLPGGSVIDESYAIMRWALDQRDPDHWWQDNLATETNVLVKDNDFDFKVHLDHYKYADRFPDHPASYYCQQAEKFLLNLEQKLVQRCYLQSDQLTFSDVAIFPFVRQFAFVDKTWFDQAPYPRLQTWLQSFLDSVLFTHVMRKYPVWQVGEIDE
jgi:glutathione S-transferase